MNKKISKLKIISLIKNWEEGSMLIVLLAVFIAASIWVPGFFSIMNMKGLALSVSMVGMVACTMLFCLASGHFDLSVEAVVAMSGILAAIVINKTSNMGYGIAAGILAGGVVGVVNGYVVSKLKINALITTLATLQIVQGLGYIISDGKAVGVSNESFFALGTNDIAGIPIPVIITVICFLVFGLLLSRTTFGKNTMAIGGNEEAAVLAGIAVDKIKSSIFIIQGLVAGFAGVILASRMNSGQPMPPPGFSLGVISACVLGGVSLSGGIGTMIGALIGVLIMGTMQNVMNLMNISPFFQYVARGLILLAAVLFDRYRQSKKA